MAVDKKLIVEIVAQTDQFEGEMKNTAGSLSTLNQGLSEFGANFGKDADATVVAMQKISSGAVVLGANMTKYVTAPILGLGAMAVNEFRKYETSFTGVLKTVDGTATEISTLRGELDNLAMTMPLTITEIHGVAEAAGQLGIPVQDIAKFTEVMTGLGISTNLSAEQASIAIARIANIMGLTSEEYERFGSTVVELGNNYATSEAEIVHFMTRIVGTGKSLNMSSQDLLGISTALTSIGITAEAGGTAISKFMSSMQLSATRGVESMAKLEAQTGLTSRQLKLMSENDGKEFKALADSLGMTATEMKNVVKNSEDLAKMTDIVNMSTNETKYTQEEYANMIKTNMAGALGLFFEGLNESNSEMALSIGLLQDMGINEVRLRDMINKSSSAYDVFNSAISDSNRAWDENIALSEEVGKRNATLDSTLTRLKNTFTLVAVQFGERMVPYLQDFADWLQNVAENIKNMPKEQIDSIISTLGKLATIGPAILVAGKAIGAVASAINMFRGLSGVIEPVVKGVGNLNGALTATSKVDLSFFDKLMGKKVYTDGQFVTMAEDINRLGKSATTTGPAVGTFSSTLGKFGNVAKNVMSSPLFKLAGSVGLATYFYDTAVNNDKFNKALEYTGDQAPITTKAMQGLGTVFQSVGSGLAGLAKGLIDMPSKLTNNALGWGDLGIAIAGVVGIATGVAPVMGIVATATVGLKLAMNSYADAQLKAHEGAILMNEGLTRIRGEVEQTSTFVDKFAGTHLKSVEDSYASVTHALQKSKLFPGEADLTNASNDIMKYSSTTKGQLDELYAGMEQSLATYYATVKNTSATQQAEDFALIQGWKTKTQKEYDTHNQVLLGLQEKYGEDSRAMTEEDYNLMLETQAKLLEMSLSKMTTEYEVLISQESYMLQQKRDNSLTITAEEYARIGEMTSTHATEILGKDKQAMADRLATLKIGLGDSAEAQEKYNQAEKEEFERHYALSLETYKNMSNDYIQLVTGKNRDELIAMEKNVEERDKHLETIRTLQNQALDDQGRADLESAQKEYMRLHELIENNKLTKEEVEALVAYLGTEIPPEMQKAMGLINGEIDFTEGLATLERQRPKFKEEGENAMSGIAVGVESNSGVVFGAISGVAQGMLKSLKKGLRSASPSKATRDIAYSINEGIEVGIDKNKYLVTDAMAEVSDIVKSADLSPEDIRFDVSRDVVTRNAFEQTMSAEPFADALANALGSAQIRAYITKKDLDNGIEDKMTTDKRRTVMAGGRP